MSPSDTITCLTVAIVMYMVTVLAVIPFILKSSQYSHQGKLEAIKKVYWLFAILYSAVFMFIVITKSIGVVFFGE